MDHIRVVALDVIAGGSDDEVYIISEMLAGAASAGAETSHSVLRFDSRADIPSLPQGARVYREPSDVSSLVEELAAADHIIVGSNAVPLDGNGEFQAFRDAVYRQAEWRTLADVVESEGFQVTVRPPGRLEDFKFPVPRREPTHEHRALAVLTPPSKIPDHDDPFGESSFFVLEEALRILGFQPSGRILATGLYEAPIEQNAVLRDEAFELGRRIASGAVIVPD